MKSFDNKVVVITGAASGIGQALALHLATLGGRLALVDVNDPALKQTAEAIRQQGGRASCHIVDVADRGKVHRLADEVIAEYGAVHVVVNNAGVALSNVCVNDLSYDDLEWVFAINLWGVIHGTKAFLPHLLRQPEANLVNVSSVFGLTASAMAAAYSASKFAVRGFTEALRQELRGTSVAVTVVFPGGIKTAIARNTRQAKGGEHIEDAEAAVKKFEDSARTTAESAAAQIVAGIGKNAPRVLIGGDARLLDALGRLKPGTYDQFMLKHVVNTYGEARAN